MQHIRNRARRMDDNGPHFDVGLVCRSGAWRPARGPENRRELPRRGRCVGHSTGCFVKP